MSGNSKPGAWPSGLVIVDKPGGITSHDVVARVRRLARTRRVGHAGTLDPMATGVLVLGIEKATRLLGHLMLTEKTYAATIRLGQATTTDDAEGEALPTQGDAAKAAGIPRARLDTEIARLTGEILQVPSSVSAIKVNGQRAYKLARAGDAPELAARPVTVYEFAVTAIRQEGDFLDIDAVIRCSSGTYIRALARDLGNALGTGGHLTALRRTAVGPYTLTQAHPLKDLENRNQDQNQPPERVRLAPAPHTAVQPPQAPLAPPSQAAPQSQADFPSGADLQSRADLQSQADFQSQADPQSQADFQSQADAGAVPVILLSAAAAAAFPRLDLTAGDARRLAQGARLPLPPDLPPLPPGDLPQGGAGADYPDAPLAAFDPDGTLVALVTAEDGRLRSLAVFVDAAASTRDA